MRRLFSIENLTFIAIILGILSGVYLKDIVINLKLVGNAFLNLLKMITIPLIFASIFVSIASLASIKDIKDMGIKAIVYYFSTTALAVFTGIVVVNFINFSPVDGMNLSSDGFEHKKFTVEALIQSFIPSNIFQSLVEGKVLHVIIFSILFAIAVLKLQQSKKEVITRFFEGVNDSMLTVAKWIINLSPLGVFALVSYIVADKGLGSILSLWQYVLAVVVGLLIHAVFNLGLIGFLFGKFNPLSYFTKVKEALLIAFSTSSSSATLPVTLEVAEERAKIDKKTAGFVLPLGATINMDGTALYEAVAAMFIASLYGIELSIGEQIIIFFTASLAAVGAAGIPSAGLVTMTLVFTAVGIPLEGIAIILAVDRFLDMLRTATNVWGDLIGAKIISRFVR
ncbi:MAG TPA: dicarboxylate/amino acid:cation symporter [Persephonella sp.]|uniref:Proton/sodium-glutamate symport protein (Glutamate-aspartate carrierprotein) n=1 Tax=Persephonella marina (strain DSM 14350 / EX-H1) TaxID=123214 RepID=C0QTJ5_PERMH|nr:MULTISPECIES: dicarboxylate/amino acid:cation symporter [Persephonella]ACO03792.1 proton/sodium-glutamate symport protein (Glutamate-aspartate carrierprotein) [Persephonella marina EX-H1]HCB70373.1 dicarboxylate/amino acid:cation symporter [Persephonella sp.]